MKIDLDIEQHEIEVLKRAIENEAEHLKHMDETSINKGNHSYRDRIKVLDKVMVAIRKQELA